MQKQRLIIGCISFVALVLVLVWNGIPTKVEATTADYRLFTPGEIKWVDAPSALPPGAKLAVLEGNPFEKGPYTMRLKMPDGYKIPPHWHSGVEHVTVISGTFNLGMGDKFDEKAGTVRILITEDDPALAEALRFSLGQSGYAVDWVQSGVLADRALRDSVFDLLILDLGLPELDGFDVLRRLRRHDSRIRVLILSARETAQEKVYGLDLGADDFLAKPFSLDELQARVRALLRRRHDTGATVIRAGELAFDTVERIASVGERTLDLSMHETAVLVRMTTPWARCSASKKAEMSSPATRARMRGNISSSVMCLPSFVSTEAASRPM